MTAYSLIFHPEVKAALAEGRPVVALESALITHGLAYPTNLETARAMEAAVAKRNLFRAAPNAEQVPLLRRDNCEAPAE